MGEAADLTTSLSDKALMEVFRQCTNEVRMTLSHTCIRFRNILVGSKDRTLERRKYNPKRITVDFGFVLGQQDGGVRAWGKRTTFETPKELQEKLNEVTLMQYTDKVCLKLTNTALPLLKELFNVLKLEFAEIELSLYSDKGWTDPQQDRNTKRALSQLFLHNPEVSSVNYGAVDMDGGEWANVTNMVTVWGSLEGIEVVKKDDVKVPELKADGVPIRCFILRRVVDKESGKTTVHLGVEVDEDDEDEEDEMDDRPPPSSDSESCSTADGSSSSFDSGDEKWMEQFGGSDIDMWEEMGFGEHGYRMESDGEMEYIGDYMDFEDF